MHVSAEATPLSAGSLSMFLASIIINNDPNLSALLRQADALSGCTFLVHDYRNRNSIYVSDSMTELSGYSALEACEGPAFVMQLTNPTDVPYLMLLQSGYVQEAK